MFTPVLDFMQGSNYVVLMLIGLIVSYSERWLSVGFYILDFVEHISMTTNKTFSKLPIP